MQRPGIEEVQRSRAVGRGMKRVVRRVREESCFRRLIRLDGLDECGALIRAARKTAGRIEDVRRSDKPAPRKRAPRIVPAIARAGFPPGRFICLSITVMRN